MTQPQPMSPMAVGIAEAIVEDLTFRDRFKVTHIAEAPKYLNMLIYGQSGVGKTRLAGSAHQCEDMTPVLFLDAEAGVSSLSHLHDLDVVRITKFEEFLTLFGELQKDMHGYKTVVVDSLPEIQKLAMYSIMAKVKAADASRDPDIPSLREHGKNLEVMRRVVRGLRDMRCNTIFTALEGTIKNELTGATVIQPSFTGRMAIDIPAFLDLVGHYTIDAKGTRSLDFAARPGAVAKDRTSKIVPPVLENPTMSDIWSKINPKPVTYP